MTIKILEEEDIVLTRAQHELLVQKWKNSQMYTTSPQSFETWLRDHYTVNRDVNQALLKILDRE